MGYEIINYHPNDGCGFFGISNVDAHVECTGYTERLLIKNFAKKILVEYHFTQPSSLLSTDRNHTVQVQVSQNHEHCHSHANNYHITRQQCSILCSSLVGGENADYG